MQMVVALLPRTGVRLLGERADRLDAACNRCRDQIIFWRCSVSPAVQVHARYSHNVRDRCTLGRSGIDPDARRILYDWNRQTCNRTLIRCDGRTRRELAWRLSPTAAFLFCRRVRELLSVFNQTAVARQTALGAS